MAGDFKDVLGCPVSFSSPVYFSVAVPIQFEAFCCRFFTLQSRTGVQAQEGPQALGSLGGGCECRPRQRLPQAAAPLLTDPEAEASCGLLIHPTTLCH